MDLSHYFFHQLVYFFFVYFPVKKNCEKQVTNFSRMLEEINLLKSLHAQEAISQVASRWATICKSKLVQGFDLEKLIEFLRILNAVAEIEANKSTSEVRPDLRANHVGLLDHSLIMLIDCTTPVHELSLIQQGELSTVLDQMAHTVATHLLGINSSSSFWMQILKC